MTHPLHPPAGLGPRARARLARGLDALDRVTQAPLRVRGHGSAAGHHVFDLQEEFEVGPRGRRFIVSVDPAGHQAVLVPVTGGATR